MGGSQEEFLLPGVQSTTTLSYVYVLLFFFLVNKIYVRTWALFFHTFGVLDCRFMEEVYLSLTTSNAMEAADRMRVQSRYVNLGENVSLWRIILSGEGSICFGAWKHMRNMSLVPVQQLPYCKKHTCGMTPYFQVITSVHNSFFTFKHDTLQWLLT